MTDECNRLYCAGWYRAQHDLEREVTQELSRSGYARKMLSESCTYTDSDGETEDITTLLMSEPIRSFSGNGKPEYDEWDWWGLGYVEFLKLAAGVLPNGPTMHVEPRTAQVERGGAMTPLEKAFYAEEARFGTNRTVIEAIEETRAQSLRRLGNTRVSRRD